MTINILTANRLADGAVVYLNVNGVWSEDLQQAATATKAQESALQARADRAVAACEIVEPYFIPVDTIGGRLQPGSQRERIRAAGPTVPAGVPGTVTPSTMETVHVSL